MPRNTKQGLDDEVLFPKGEENGSESEETATPRTGNGKAKPDFEVDDRPC